MVRLDLLNLSALCLLHKDMAMRVLITNQTMAGRTGTETFVRDLALGLKNLGHHPIVYSPELGPLADELHEATIPVVDDLSKIAEPPDVIHGHHRHAAVSAMVRFPSTPAIFVVHDWHSWHDEPPRFPQILRYVAIDETRRERLVIEHGIDPSHVEIIPNGVDTQRFAARSPLPDHPSRALVFSSYVTSDHQLHSLRKVCARRKIHLDAIGTGLHRPATNPEEILGTYDVVFALGRSAMEAMAVGSGVVVWGVEGLGGFVTLRRFENLLSRNFGRRCLSPCLPKDLDRALQDYSPQAAVAVRDHVRAHHSLEAMLAAYTHLYAKVIEEGRQHPVPNASVLAAVSGYMEDCVPRVQVEGLLSRRSRRSGRRIRAFADVMAYLGSAATIYWAWLVERLAFRTHYIWLCVSLVFISASLIGLLFHLRSRLRLSAGALARRSWARMVGLG